ncbi:hypothetical protein AVEN_240919-1 [Araneus ventricosus]|uniref:C2H2-type domain-containing protein n=1 Tax=Araneus ventricosus TaxID=182803 RepID=A0A4Y2P9D3_ARAVE|nr:hypothetical protein AVEN_240919-1 [Araneus ventricosus]
MLKEKDFETSKIWDCRVMQNTSENMSQSLCYKHNHTVGVNHTLNFVSASDSVAGPSGISSNRSRSSVCGKEFAENEDRRIHSLTHTVEKPFDCKSCEKRYAREGALNRHLKS